MAGNNNNRGWRVVVNERAQQVLVLAAGLRLQVGRPKDAWDKRVQLAHAIVAMFAALKALKSTRVLNPRTSLNEPREKVQAMRAALDALAAAQGKA